jgi:hypothetical protein
MEGALGPFELMKISTSTSGNVGSHCDSQSRPLTIASMWCHECWCMLVYIPYDRSPGVLATVVFLLFFSQVGRHASWAEASEGVIIVGVQAS